jgi:hypothetical protein
LLAFWQTAGAFYEGSTAGFARALQGWFVTITHNGATDDNSIFLFFIVMLGFILAYTSAWLVYRTRSPWLMIVANAVVLLINLSNVDAGYTIFLVVFLIAALLLLLRFNLYESVRRWQRQGLRYADDIGWDVMQAGAPFGWHFDLLLGFTCWLLRLYSSTGLVDEFQSLGPIPEYLEPCFRRGWWSDSPESWQF